MKPLIKKREEPFIYNKYYLSAQEKWVRKMEYLTDRLSRRALIYLLFLYAFLQGGYFLYNIYAECSQKNSEINKNPVAISKIKTINFKK
ncbi:hypothetical protein [Flavobacterium ginsenosidimutans]|uniref:hypothetical protein n=1 Tax=Flavobacterium ginsenosidimutans TaxID=687844 RepID=UPI003D9911BE